MTGVVTVYAVESGMYSDHVQHAIFTTKELAEHYIAALEEAHRRQERAMWGDDSNYLSDYTVESYQLWDVLPVLTPVAGDQRTRFPEGVYHPWWAE